jgi:hypothetical protein
VAPERLHAAVRASSASGFVGLWHEDELAFRRRALQQLVSVTSLGQRQALRNDRVDLVCSE